jgi:hypothetical protein
MKQYKNFPGKNVYFTALQINKHTVMMFDMMKAAFGDNFLIKDVKDQEDF